MKIIFILLGIAAIIAGVIFIKPATPSPVSSGTTHYSSSTLGVSFDYKNTYKLEERSDGFEGKKISVITLIDKNVVIPDMSEGPPVISLIVVPNPEELPLDQWIRTKSISNYYLSSMGEMG